MTLNLVGVSAPSKEEPKTKKKVVATPVSKASDKVKTESGKDLTKNIISDLGINQNDISAYLQGDFAMSEWDLIPIIRSTGIRIWDALLASSKDEQGLTLRTVNTFYGGSGIGKSTALVQIAGNIVRPSEHGRIIIWDAEKTTTVHRLRSLNLPMDRVTLIKQSTGIENFFSMAKKIATFRHSQLEEHGETFIMENPYVFVVDSISAMASDKEEEVDSDVHKGMGTSARLWSALLKIYNDVFFKYNITVLFVNQVRDKIALTPSDNRKNLVFEKNNEALSGEAD